MQGGSSSPAAVPPGTLSGARGSQGGAHGDGVPAGRAVGGSPINPKVPPNLLTATGAPTVPAGQASSSRTFTPPGLGFLGCEPPSGARTWGPRKPTIDMSSFRQDGQGISSEERSTYFEEYRRGRIPGSPGLDQLRANANLPDAPSSRGHPTRFVHLRPKFRSRCREFRCDATWKRLDRCPNFADRTRAWARGSRFRRR